MKKTSAIIAALISATVLTGCGDPSKEDLLADKALYDEYYDKCDNGEIDIDKQVCQDVLEILQDDLGNMFGGIFGK